MKTGIEVKTEFFILSFVYFLCTPVIEVNGQSNRRKWGTHFFDLTPGDYVIKIYFPYLFIPKFGANQINVTISEGDVKKINYKAPNSTFSPGKIKEV